MKHLRLPIRRKTIGIANALLDQGYDVGTELRIRLAKVREWADRHWSEQFERDLTGER